MSRKKKRGFVILGLFSVAAFAVALILSALNDNIVFFLSPGEIAAKSLQPNQRLRLGGMVEAGSVKREGQKIIFTVTDGKKKLKVEFKGALPDLFREGQGVVAEGRLQGDLFLADMVLARHDETYMPRDVADALKKQGYWRDREVPKGAQQ